MKTKKQIVKRQIELQEKIQKAGFNIVECGSCGTVLLHEIGEDKINCFCGETMALSDCPDLYYSGMKNNAEFETETEVVFKKLTFNYIEDEETITTIDAIFPEMKEGKETVLGYTHIGQHSEYHTDFLTDGFVGEHKVETATEEEYTQLKKELEQIGYILKVVN